jgi:hypothetical protein
VSRKPPKIPVSDYQDLAQFCKDRGFMLELAVTDGLWSLTVSKGKLVICEQVRGEPYEVFDQLALDVVIGLAKAGRLS